MYGFMSIYIEQDVLFFSSGIGLFRSPL